MSPMMFFLFMALLFVSLFVAIRFASGLINAGFILPREIERRWGKPLPEAEQDRTTETKHRVLLAQGYKGVLLISAVYVPLLLTIPVAFIGTTALPIFYPFWLIGLVLLSAVFGRAAIHYWRRRHTSQNTLHRTRSTTSF